jgi:hypothetical protein
MSSLAASDPLTLPTWLTAVFTGVLAVGAIVTAVFAILAFRKQSTEVRILQEQAQRESEQRLRSQASRVFVWQEFETDPDEVRDYAIAAGPKLIIDDISQNPSAGRKLIIVAMI